MKLLFVDNSADLQQKWIDPLRAEGWGALRARSSEDADRMLLVHGDSIEIVVISESLVRWAETHDYPFVVLVRTWNDRDVMTHQNSSRSAFHYLPFEGRVQDLVNAVQSFRGGGPASGGKKEGTQWGVTKTIALEDFSGVLTKPELSKPAIESSIRLDAPSVLFGGEKTNASALAPTAPPADVPSAAEPEVEKTMIRAAVTAEISLENGPAAGSKPEAEPPADATRISIPTPADPSLPEVMEIKLDLDGPETPAEATRLSIQATTVSAPPKPPAPADATVVLESTKLELGGDDEGISIGNDAMEEEQELVGELSINEEIQYQQAVGAPTASAAASNPIPPPPSTTRSSSVQAPSMVQSQASVIPPPPVVRVIEGDEALKNYLALREQDVAVLTGQVRSSQERIQQLEMQLKVEKARGTELQHIVQKQEQTLKNYDNEKRVELEVLYRQIEDLNVQLQERSNKAHAIEARLKVTTEEVNKVKERVRVDIRRIRVREKELESQLEILKKDSTALLQARDEKILELKRKLDLLEFNMELIQEQYNKERREADELRNRLKDAAKAMRQAGGLLEQ